MAKRREKRERRSVVLEPDAAGIDIGAEEIYVVVPPDRDEESTRRFSSFTVDLQTCMHLPIGSVGVGFGAGDGIDRRLLDSAVSDPGGARVQSLFSQRALSEECARTQERRLRLRVDPVSALGRVAAGQLPSTRGDLCHSYPVAAPWQPAGDARVLAGMQENCRCFPHCLHPVKTPFVGTSLAISR